MINRCDQNRHDFKIYQYWKKLNISIEHFNLTVQFDILMTFQCANEQLIPMLQCFLSTIAIYSIQFVCVCNSNACVKIVLT